MSEETKVVEGQQDEVSAEDLKRELEIERKKNERLLQESKTYKTRAQSAESSLEESAKKKLEADGKLQEILELERKKSKELAEKLNSTTSTVLKEKLKAEVLKHAKDVHDVEMLLKVTEHKDVLQIDQESLSVSGVEDFVKKARESHWYLFSQAKLPTTETSRVKSDGVKNIDGSDYITALKAAKTQSELDAVRRRFGRE